MTIRKTALVFVLLAVVGVAAVALLAQVSVQDTKTAAPTIKPYQVLSGQVATTSYEVVYVLDNESRRLAALKYDWNKNQLVPIAGRDLAKDFSSAQSGGYSMVTTQLTNKTGLLYVTDYAAHKAIVYQVDLTNNTVTPQQPVDLKKLFGG